jgi:hypothetical protein
MNLIQAYIALVLIIMILSSVLYKVNVFSQIAEYTFVATGIANVVVLAINSINNTAFKPFMGGNTILLIPLIIGALVFGRFVKKSQGVGLWPVAFTVGAGAAVAFRGSLEASVLTQITQTIIKITDINNLILFLILVLTSFYFIYSFDKTKGPMPKIAMITRYVMMIGFGATFANAAMGRIGRLVGFIQQMLIDLGLPV